MKKVIITSPATDAGKTFLASGLVEATAWRGIRTLFLELDETVGDAIRVFDLVSQAKSPHPTIASWSVFSNWPSSCLETRAGASLLPRPDGFTGLIDSESMAQLLAEAEPFYDIAVADLGSDCYASYWPDMVKSADFAFLVADCDEKALARVNSFLCSYCPAHPPHKWIMAVNARHRKSDYKPKDLTKYFEGADQLGEVLVIPHFPALDRSPSGTFPANCDLADKLVSAVFGRGRSFLIRHTAEKNNGLSGCISMFTRLFRKYKTGSPLPDLTAPIHVWNGGINHEDFSGSSERQIEEAGNSDKRMTAPDESLAAAGVGHNGYSPLFESHEGMLLLVGDRSLKLNEALVATGWKTTSDQAAPAGVAIVDTDQLSAAAHLNCPKVALGEGKISEWYQPVDDDVVVVAGPALVFSLLDQYRVRTAASRAAAVKQAGPVLALPSLSGRTGKMIAFYSGAQGYQGKTMLAINSGVLLTSRGLSACVVDMDGDKAGLTLLLGYTEMRPPVTDLAIAVERMSSDAVQGLPGSA